MSDIKAKTFNELKALFKNIRTKHKQLKSFGFGEEHEINGAKEEDRIYPKLWIIPVDSITREQTKERTFEFLCFDLVHKDEENEDEVLSDTEQILDDIIKILINESDDYSIIGEPQLFPFTEKYMDDVTGWRTLVTVETKFNSNYCDIPTEDL